MKKRYLILFTTLLTLSLMACKKNSSDIDNTSESKEGSKSVVSGEITPELGHEDIDTTDAKLDTENKEIDNAKEKNEKEKKEIAYTNDKIEKDNTNDKKDSESIYGFFYEDNYWDIYDMSNAQYKTKADFENDVLKYIDKISTLLQCEDWFSQYNKKNCT